ncbi:CaiB/BaiF CoA transferase family protein [Nocardiopsis mangrovi]|uniref:CaiB/BaiF CoA transferase family protein n=1 Tax=Nocardiopsis mangrovi TaxID=1179818 RepID=A0ABV9DZV3_9ACTN
MRALEGVTVVSVEQAIAAPLATRHLADLGARVIKVERPGGDFARHHDTTVNGLSSHFVWANRGKESVVLDLKDPGDAATMRALVLGADVFVQNLAPGAAARMGLGAEALRAAAPRLITCGISGYGTEGPYAHKKAYDLLVQCEAGVVSVTGTEAEPAKAGIPVADIAAAMYAFSGILTALFRREHTGEGAVLDISMLEALGEWMGFPLYYAQSGAAPPRTGARHAAIAPYGPFGVGDGSRVFLSVQNDREWRALCATVLGDPGLADDPRFAANPGRVANERELSAVIEAGFAGLDAAGALARLDAAGIANARLRTPEEFAAHPQLAARGRWTRVPSPAGTIPALKPPIDIDGEEPAMGPVPDVGEHTEAIRAELARARPAAAEEAS